MEQKKSIAQMPDHELMQLADRIVAVVEEGKQKLAVSINQTVKSTYWNVGRHIVEFEQKGNVRAKYGTSLLSQLAKILRAKVGRGYSHPNLNNMRKFYLLYPNFQTSEKLSNAIVQTSDKLTWSHICELITIDEPLDEQKIRKVGNMLSALKKNGVIRLSERQKRWGVVEIETH